MLTRLKQWISSRLKQADEPLPFMVTVILLCAALLIPLTWFEPGHIIFRGDPMMALDPVRFFMERWSAWQGKVNLGAEMAVPTASLIHQFIQAIPAFFGGSDQLSEIWHFTVWFVLPGVTIVIFISDLARRLRISQWAVPVAVAFYLFNLYRIALFADNNHFGVYAALPLILYFVAQGTDARRGWLPAAAGFGLSTLLAAQAGTNPPQYLMIWLPVAIYGGVLSLMHYQAWRHWLRFWLAAAVFTLLLNLFWIVPFGQIMMQQAGLEAAGNLNWLDDLSKHTSLPRVLRLIGAWGWFDTWRGEPYAPYAAIYSQSPWWQLAIVPAYLCLLVLAFRRSWNRYVLSILAIGLLGLIFSQGTHPPFGNIFRWTVENVPFFWVFRSPWYKFTNLTAFAYASLISLGVGALVGWLQSTTIRPFRWVGYLFALVVIALPLVVAHPLITGSFWLTKEDVKKLAPDLIPYPAHIRQAADWLNGQPGETGIALLPYQGSAVYRWGYAAPVDPLQYFSRRPVFFRGDRIGYVSGATPGATAAFRALVDRLYNSDPAAEQVARLLGIEYIVQRNDIAYEFYDDTDSPEFVRDRLAAQPNLSLIRSFGDWDIYQFAHIQPNPIFATTWATGFKGQPVDSLASILSERRGPDEAFPAVLFAQPVQQPSQESVEMVLQGLKREIPAPSLAVKQGLNRYNVSGQATQPFLLVLNQSYNSGWRAVSRDAEIVTQVVANGYAPAWLIRPNGPFEIVVTYGPQRTVVPLATLSFLTAIFLVWILRRFSLINQEK